MSETIRKYEDRLPEILDMIYALSKLNFGKLPLPQQRAHNMAVMDKAYVRNIERHLDGGLRRAGISTVDFTRY